MEVSLRVARMLSWIAVAGCAGAEGTGAPEPLVQVVVPEVVRPIGTAEHRVWAPTTTTTTPTTEPLRLVPLPPPGIPACDGAPETFFTDVALCAGLNHALHIRDPLLGALDMYVTGQAWADLDGDPWLDLVITSPNGDNRVYLGSADGTFVERGQDGPSGIPAFAAVAADYDSDGDADLFLSGPEQDTLFENTGTSLVAVVDGPSDPRTSYGGAFSDLDGDGWLELYFTSYACPGCATIATQGDERADGFWVFDGTGWTDRAADAFPESWRTWGLGFAAIWADPDNDGDLDLYVINDRGRDQDDDPDGTLYRNAFWVNEGPGCGFACLREDARDLGLAGFMNGMGVDAGDFDGDGDLDFAVSDSGITRLFRNDGGAFADVGAELGMASVPADAWGEVWLDYDNDGDLDLYTAVTGQDRVDRNEGGWFVDDTGPAIGLHTENSRGVAVADYDRDGKLDLAVGTIGGAYRLLRNTHDNANHWLGLKLVGAGAGGRDALGARVTVTDDSGRVQIREVKSGASNGSGNELGLHFGLGTALPVEVRVRWPDGFEEVVAPTADAWWELSR